MPNLMPQLFTASTSSFNEQPILFSFVNQSPSPLLSSSLFPNQPSSITSISTPSSAAFFARFTMEFLSISKYEASQLFTSTGLTSFLYFPLHTFSLIHLCRFCDKTANPLSLYDMITSGAIILSPDFRQ